MIANCINRLEGMLLIPLAYSMFTNFKYSKFVGNNRKQ